MENMGLFHILIAMKNSAEFNLNVVVVCLDLSPMDNILISYVHQIATIRKFRRIYFLHVCKELELPEKLADKYPDLLAPLDESLEHDIKQKVDNFTWAKGIELTVDVMEGNPIREILHYSHVKESDMIVMGRKKQLKGSGVASSRISRKSICSVLLVPEILPEKLERILIPIDFAATSERSYRVGESFAKKGALISMIHLYHVPHGYSKTGKSYEEFDTIMLQNAQKEFRHFTKTLNMKAIPDSHFVNGDKENPEAIIMEYAGQISADIIVIGSKGKSTSAFILLGSMAEKLLSTNDTVPMLIVKAREENMGLFEALKRL